MQRSSKVFLLLISIYWLPFVISVSQYHPHKTVKTLPDSDAVIVFGTLVRDANISPLLRERLNASIAIYNANKVKEIVVSNTPKAALVMQKYLIKKSIPSKHIKMDTEAEKTPDSCRYEKKLYPQGRKLIFISQGYHLPRINYQCKKLGVNAILFPAEKLENRSSLFSSFMVFSIRTKRYFREAGLTLLAMLNVY